MRFLVCSAPHADTFGYSMPPPGLLRLGGFLRSRGVEVLLEDLAYRLGAGDLPEGDGLADAAAAWIGRRLTPGTVLGLSTMGATLPVALAIAERVRDAHPGVPILFGGPGVQGVDEALVARFECLDAVLRGEGETALAELFAKGTPLAFEGVEGFTWRDEHGRVRREAERAPMGDLGDVEAPAWDLLPPLAAYKSITGAEDGLVPVDSGRGCAYDCSFCTIGRYWKRRSRTLPAARLADEIEALREMPGARQAYLCHDIFGADKRHALAFCREMEERRAAGRALPFEVRARLDHLDDELVLAMRDAGCYRVLVGIESASARVRTAANKEFGQLTSTALLRRVRFLADHGITPILSLILGLPGEERADLAETLDFVADAAHQTGAGGAQISLHLVNPQPGCGLGEEHGAASRPVDGIPPDMALGAGLTLPERELIAAHPDLFSSWALLPGDEETHRFHHAIARELPELLMRYPQTHAALRALSGRSTLDLFEERHAQRFSFEAQARLACHPTVDALLAWEQAKVRAVARGGPWRRLELSDAGEELAVDLFPEVLALPADIGQVQEALQLGVPLPAPEPAHFLVSVPRTGRGASGQTLVTTTRISAGLADVLLMLARAADTRTLPIERDLLDHLAALEDGTLLTLDAPCPTPRATSPST